MDENTFTTTSWDEQPTWEGAATPRLAHVRARNTFAGVITGESEEQLTLHYDADTGVYCGYERITGTVAGREGTFLLHQEGRFGDDGITGEWTVVPGSGTDELASLRGTGGMRAADSDGAHYIFQHSFE